MKRRLAMAALALVLGACAAPPVQRTAPSWSGRLSLQVWSDPPQSFHAAFELQGSAESGELTLLSPIGGVLARLEWTPGQAILERGQERWQRPRVDQLIDELTSAALPVQALFDWLQGRPGADGPWRVDLSAHAQGRLLAQRLQPLPRAELRLLFEH